ncbi:MAG: transcription/translation regulatory transformer protein RfaH [Burkholderiales bacterium]|nr:transcription/translation regulatory transformer protein RfaH [Burkholderiales bacterium]
MFNDQHPTPPALLTTQQAADRLGLTTTSLHDLRCKDDGLPIVRKGLLVGYQLEDIQAFEQRELFAIVKQVLAADRPMPLIRAIAKAVMAPPVSDAVISPPVPFSASGAGIAWPSNIHRLPIAKTDSEPTPGHQATAPDAEPVRSSKPAMPSPVSSSASSATLSWYVVHTKIRQEALAMTNLNRQGFECYMPMLKMEKMRRHKATLVEEPMFPRYLFIRLDTSGSGQSWSPIRSTLGVSQLVRFGGHPAVVDSKLIDLLRTREQVGQPERLFKAGEKVVVADGPFSGIEAIFKTADAESRSMILLEMLSKPVAMRIETASLRKTG